MSEGLFSEQLAVLPAALQQTLSSRLAAWLSQDQKPSGWQQAPFKQSFITACAASDFIARTALHKPEIICQLWQQGDLQQNKFLNDFSQEIKSCCDQATDLKPLSASLRRLRHYHMVRIAWRDLTGMASLSTTLAELSALADAFLIEVSQWCYQYLTQIHGIPQDKQGNALALNIIAVGKLGGLELNYSSDIDLICCFAQSGETCGGRKTITNEQFFQRQVQLLMKLFSDVTEHGFLFRVDLRLRPFGESGPLAITLSAMESYYQQHGREWERYALLKARMVNHTAETTALKEMIQHFVYRRYVDFSVIDSLRDLKKLMDRETRQRGLQTNIKRGAGGIREVEFIVQVFQLIRGGKFAQLQQPHVLAALPSLANHYCLAPEVVQGLIHAYVFLRNTENRLQMIADQQTQTLPGDEVNRARLAFAMGFADWMSFYKVLQQHREIVRQHFNATIHYPTQQNKQISKDQGLLVDLQALWLGKQTADNAIHVLQQAGFKQQLTLVSQLLTQFATSYRVRQLHATAKQRLDNLLPLFLLQVAKVSDPLQTLTRLIALLEAIIRRSAYLSLLLENPRARERLVNLLNASKWIANEITRFPLLLDELLDAAMLYAPITSESLAEEIRQRLLLIPEQDLEQQMECLRECKHGNVLRLAAAEVMQKQPLRRISDSLSDIASTLLVKAKNIAWQQLLDEMGLSLSKDLEQIQSSLAIIAYGKLGGYELGYASDLDVVFLYDLPERLALEGSLSPQEFYIRLIKRLIPLLSVKTMMGNLYNLDLRLRPAGSSGLLVSRLDTYQDYQLNKAWTWEHQALVRARMIEGSPAMQKAFQAVREQVLCTTRDESRLRDEVVQMRAKMAQHAPKLPADRFDLKLGDGGITDLEFMVQYWVLRWAHRYPGLVQFTDNWRLLEQLAQYGLLTSVDAEALSEAYLAYRELSHQCALQESPAQVALETAQPYRKTVLKAWHEVFETSNG